MTCRPPQLPSASTGLAGASGGVEKIGRLMLSPRFLLVAAAVTLIFAAAALWSDAGGFWTSLSGFPAPLFAVACGCAASNYVFRYLRWEYYLRLHQIRLRPRFSFTVFLSGFLLGMNPGRAGELLKASFVNQEKPGVTSEVLAVVIAERLTDLIAVAVGCLFGFLLVGGGGGAIAIGIAFIFAVMLVLMHPQWLEPVLGRLEMRPAWRPLSGKLRQILRQAAFLLSPAPLAVSVLLGFAAWAMEAIAAVLILRHYAADYPAATGAFYYFLATLVGGLTFLPGGLIGAELTLFALLSQTLPKPDALAATLIIRGATLWWGLLLSALACARLFWKHKTTAAAQTARTGAAAALSE